MINVFTLHYMFLENVLFEHTTNGIVLKDFATTCYEFGHIFLFGQSGDMLVAFTWA